MQNLQITVNGIEITPILSFSIEQAFNKHHTFDCTFAAELIEGLETHVTPINHSKDLLGETIIINVDHGNLTFKGVICEVERSMNNSFNQVIILRGFSPTISFETAGGIFRSFKDKTLPQIINILFALQGSTKMGTRINLNSGHQSPIVYLTQYNESTFTFLNRLSALYGEFFYYDGENIHFGKSPTSKKVNLLAQNDVQEMNMKIYARPLNFDRYDYRYLENNIIQSVNSGQMPPNSPLLAHAYQTSMHVFPYNGLAHSELETTDDSQLLSNMRKQKAALISSLMEYHGITTKTDLNLGCHAKIVSPPTGTLEEVLITYIKHSYDVSGRYLNEFKGLQSSVPIISVADAAIPRAEPQLGTVYANDDPYRKGRVQVKLHWHFLDTSADAHTDWIRVMVPDAGVSSSDTADRGYVFIPEVGDQVVVGFYHGDPDRPYVMGSVFHGQNSSAQNNDINRISSKLGNTLILNDTMGFTGIMLSDRNENMVHISSDRDTVSITAIKNIELNCANLIMNVENDISINHVDALNVNAAEMNLNLSNKYTAILGGDYNLTAANISETALGNMNSLATGDIQHTAITGDATYQSSGNINVQAALSVTHQAGQSFNNLQHP